MFDIATQLEEKYRTLRTKAENIANYYNNLANSNLEFKNLQKNINDLIIKIAKGQATNNLNSTYINELKNLISQKKIVLKKLKIRECWLTPIYKCKLCKDTGLHNGKTCECKKIYFNEMVLNSLDITYDLTKKLDEIYNEELKNKFKIFCDKFPNLNIKNCLFQGKTGSGKTFLAECITSELTKKGKIVIDINSFKLNNLLYVYHYTFNKENNQLLEILNNCDLLIIDDLGSEPIIKNITIEYYLFIINERLIKNKSTIITTNLNNENIIDIYNERFLSRINCKKNWATIEFNNEDLRRKK